MHFLSVKPIKEFVLILLTVFKVIKLVLGESTNFMRVLGIVINMRNVEILSYKMFI